MKDFLTGVEDKYDKRLLEGRLTIEGNVIACIYSDPLILDEIELTRKDFITSDGSFYFQLAKRLRKNGYSVFDEVTILSSTSESRRFCRFFGSSLFPERLQANSSASVTAQFLSRSLAVSDTTGTA